MLAIVLISYNAPMEVIERHTAAHRAFLKLLFDAGHLVSSGPFVPRTGGMLLLRGESLSAIEALLANDPFRVHGVATHDLREWAPTLGREVFEPKT